MKKVLFVSASPRGDQSISRKLSQEVIAALKAKEGSLIVSERDLSTSELPFLSQDLLNAVYTPEEKRSVEQREALKVSDRLVDELVSADVVVFAAPLWNFSVPASVKAWMDLVARVGRTFRYTEAGPVGLLDAKTVYLVKASGGVFSEGPAKAMDFYENFIPAFFGFLGLKDVRLIRAEGLAIPGREEAAIKAAQARIAEVVGAPVQV